MGISEVNANLILASASPRRKALLNQIGVVFRVIVSDIDETALGREKPGDYVCRLAREKALDVVGREACNLQVLGADTAVLIDGRILGKPEDRVHAIDMLMQLSGHTHEVWSAVALVLRNGAILERLNVTRVTFSTLGRDWIEAYCDSGDPMDKAGAYGVQGMAAQKISQLEGSYSGVMGLPLYETSEILTEAGLLNQFESGKPSK
jgi:septum formation protein